MIQVINIINLLSSLSPSQTIIHHPYPHIFCVTQMETLSIKHLYRHPKLCSLAAQNPPLNAQKSLQDWPVLTQQCLESINHGGNSIFYRQKKNTPEFTKMTGWKITIFNRKYIFKWWIFQCNVSFRGCISANHENSHLFLSQSNYIFFGDREKHARNFRMLQ